MDAERQRFSVTLKQSAVQTSDAVFARSLFADFEFAEHIRFKFIFDYWLPFIITPQQFNIFFRFRSLTTATMRFFFTNLGFKNCLEGLNF